MLPSSLFLSQLLVRSCPVAKLDHRLLGKQDRDTRCGRNLLLSLANIMELSYSKQAALNCPVSREVL